MRNLIEDIRYGLGWVGLILVALFVFFVGMALLGLALKLLHGAA